MIITILFALAAGALVSLSRQINGRLALATSPLIASFWNHLVGFAALSLLGIFIGGLIPPGAADAPWFAYLGGPLGVVFVAAGSWLIARIGAANTALLVISGQMVSGVALDLLTGVPTTLWVVGLGVLLIMGGVLLMQRR
jgi:bacterial/archaeal transporter family-2 protein